MSELLEFLWNNFPAVIGILVLLVSLIVAIQKVLHANKQRQQQWYKLPELKSLSNYDTQPNKSKRISQTQQSQERKNQEKDSH